MLVTAIDHHLGGKPGIEEAEGWFWWWLWMDWLYVSVIYSKCKYQWGVMHYWKKVRFIFNETNWRSIHLIYAFLFGPRWLAKPWDWQTLLTRSGEKHWKMWKSKVILLLCLIFCPLKNEICSMVVEKGKITREVDKYLSAFIEASLVFVQVTWYHKDGVFWHPLSLYTWIKTTMKIRMNSILGDGR